jgi:putative DNA primase/helicase
MPDLYDFMSRAGFDPPDHFTPGVIARFSRNGKRADKAGWLLAFPDGQGACFGDWRSGEEHCWQAERERPQSEAERAAFRAMVEHAKRQAAEAREREHAEAAARAAALWAEAKPAPAEHPYLTAKGITPAGVRLAKDGRLIVPVFGPDGLMSLQFIAPSGEKRFLAGGKVKGGHVWLPDGNAPQKAIPGAADGLTIYVCEGWATGKPIHAAMGAPVCVAFNAGNLADVARMVRAKYPAARLVIAGDDDRETAGNPGRVKATEAAEAVGAEVVFPRFPPGVDGSDFNDLCRVAGLDAVRAALGDEPGIRLTDWLACERFQGAPPVREWLVSGIFPAGKPALLAAAGGIGKSFLLLELARGVAGGARHCSLGELAKHGPAVYLTAEDDAIEVHSR